VLCAGRSGSTLLRFLLDAHPEVACPPETNLPALCAQLATVWSLIEGAPLSAERGDEPPVIPEAAIAGIRQTMDMMVGSYLTRRGKRRYCDKSLGTARFAELLQRVYPEAKFLCLYRHPMDVIASGLEACPWGLNGYGFDPYIAGTPGNAVFAMARFWADNTAAITAAEELLKDACHRIRYEDMVADPEDTAQRIFSFLGVAAVPGIPGRCFTPDRERFGPADYKIWHTSSITTGSVGRGWSIPVGMIAPQVLEQINELARKLDYVAVDGQWGTAVVPADMRINPVTPEKTASATTSARSPLNGRQGPPVAERIGSRLADGLARLNDRFARHWDACLAESFGLVITPRVRASGQARWRVDLATRAAGPAEGAADDTQWDVIGAADAWDRVLSGEMNLNVALRRCELRYCDAGDTGQVAADTRIGMLADLLGLTSWSPADESSTAAIGR
jgi:hypothetical protein